MTSRTTTTIRRDASARPALPFWAWCTIAVFCTVLYTAAVPVMSAAYEVDLLLAFVIASAQCGSLLLALFRPIAGAVLQLAAVVALALATLSSDTETWPLPVTGLISLGALILLLGLRERWAVSVTVWWSSIVVLVIVIVTSPDRYAAPDGWGTNLTIYASYTAIVLIAAIAIGQRQRIRAELAQTQRDIELEHARRLHVEERARIARELHDVVAHSMSIIHMQALSAPFRLKAAGAPDVDQEFTDIARQARTALAEMRQLLGALRPGEGDADLLPQPQLADLPDLVSSTSRAGSRVALTVPPEAERASPVVQLTIYRVVQEALSNVVRHAPGAAAEVTVSQSSGSLRIEVRNSPTPSSDGEPLTPDRGGQGLRGMKERVHLLGGRLETGPTDDGGYLVTAVIPAAIPQTQES